MLILHFNINLFPFIHHIKSLIRYYPTIAGIIKQILVKITDMISISFVYLSNTFRFYYFLKCFTINFCIKCKFNRIYKIVIKLP